MEILISGASSGIGRAAAIHLARLGHNVWAGVRSAEATASLEKLNVRGLNPIQLDVVDASSVEACVHELKKRAGVLHALVNNAGLAVGGPVEAVSLADWRRQMDVNFFGLVHLTQQCLPLLRESKGRIVNVSSVSGKIGFPLMAPYCASKFAVEGFSDSLRRELRRHGVQVSLIEPAAIATPIWEKAQREGEQRIAEFSSDMESIYSHELAQMRQALPQIQQSAAPVEWVTRAIVQALTSARPRTRYPVGRHAGLLMALVRWLPDRWQDYLLKR